MREESLVTSLEFLRFEGAKLESSCRVASPKGDPMRIEFEAMELGSSSNFLGASLKGLALYLRPVEGQLSSSILCEGSSKELPLRKLFVGEVRVGDWVSFSGGSWKGYTLNVWFPGYRLESLPNFFGASCPLAGFLLRLRAMINLYMQTEVAMQKIGKPIARAHCNA